jgi:hypothetical protein
MADDGSTDEQPKSEEGKPEIDENRWWTLVVGVVGGAAAIGVGLWGATSAELQTQVYQEIVAHFASAEAPPRERTVLIMPEFAKLPGEHDCVQRNGTYSVSQPDPYRTDRLGKFVQLTNVSSVEGWTCRQRYRGPERVGRPFMGTQGVSQNAIVVQPDPEDPERWESVHVWDTHLSGTVSVRPDGAYERVVRAGARDGMPKVADQSELDTDDTVLEVLARIGDLVSDPTHRQHLQEKVIDAFALVLFDIRDEGSVCEFDDSPKATDGPSHEATCRYRDAIVTYDALIARVRTAATP